MGRALINIHNQKVYPMMKHAARDYNMKPPAFCLAFNKGSFPELAEYRGQDKAMEFASEPRGRVEIFCGSARRVYPFNSVSAFNDIMDTVQYMPPVTRKYLYLKSKINK
jgi:hypothetical protein